MNVRAFSLVVLAISASIFSTYACEGDDPTTVASTSGDGGETTDAASDSSVGDAPSTADTGAIDSGVDSGPLVIARVFRSSAKYLGNFGGTAQADAHCQTLATAAGLGTGWKAWLSSSSYNAKDRVQLGTGPISLVDGTPIAAHGSDMLGDAGLEHAIDHDETGTVVIAAPIWTGTRGGGTLAPAPNATCSDWLSVDGGGAAGAASTSSPAWTDSATQQCNMSYALYCFGP